MGFASPYPRHPYTLEALALSPPGILKISRAVPLRCGLLVLLKQWMIRLQPKTLIVLVVSPWIGGNPFCWGKYDGARWSSAWWCLPPKRIWKQETGNGHRTTPISGQSSVIDDSFSLRNWYSFKGQILTGTSPSWAPLVLWWPLMVWRRTTFEGILGVQRFLSFKRFGSVLELEKDAKVCFLSWFEWHSTLQHSASGAASSNQVPQQAEVVGQPSTMVKVWLEPGLDLLHSHWHVPVWSCMYLWDFDRFWMHLLFKTIRDYSVISCTVDSIWVIVPPVCLQSCRALGPGRRPNWCNGRAADQLHDAEWQGTELTTEISMMHETLQNDEPFYDYLQNYIIIYI